MLKVEHLEAFNIHGALRGMRNPLNSWDKSDSYWCPDSAHFIDCNSTAEHCPREDVENFSNEVFCVGCHDLQLAKKLGRAGDEHRKFMRQIFVCLDITAPLYWWAEFDTYKIGVTRNSCSFMHKGVSRPFDINDFSIHDDRVYQILTSLPQQNMPIVYPYETEEYRDYTCENGRRYKVFKNGRVFAYPFQYVDTKGRFRSFDERECMPSVTPTGYFEINLGGQAREKWMLHRLVASVWIDNPQHATTVNHIDGNKANNCVENLEWCSRSENIQKGFESGLFANGQSLHAKYLKWKNGHTNVSPFIKQQIRLAHTRDGLTCAQIAETFDITVRQANNIISYPGCEHADLFMLCYCWEDILRHLNAMRDVYLETKDANVFQQLRCLLPSGYNQRSTITMNYENVVKIVKQRSGHKLDEWHTLIDELMKLPYMKELVNACAEND